MFGGRFAPHEQKSKLRSNDSPKVSGILKTLLFPWGSSAGLHMEPKSSGSLSCKAHPKPSSALTFPWGPHPLPKHITSLIPTNSTSPRWENSKTWTRITAAQLQSSSLWSGLPPTPHNSILVLWACETAHHLPSIHPLQPRQSLSAFQLLHWLQRTSSECPSKMPVETWLAGKMERKEFFKNKCSWNRASVNRKCQIVS